MGGGEDGCARQVVLLPVVEHPAVVVALADFQRLVVLTDVAAYLLGLAEVHGGIGHRGYLAGGNLRGVGGKPAVGVELELMLEHAAGVVTFEVEVSVVGEVDDGLGVGGGAEFDGEFVAVVPAVGDGGLYLAGESFLAVGRGVVEAYAVAYEATVPDAVLETVAAVAAVGPVVDGQPVLLAA